MASVPNIFVSGRMDSDTDYSLLDNKGYVYALNMRPSGYGKDGAMHFIKGSVDVSDFSEKGTMTVLGMYGGEDNKLYTFLGRRDGLSKITETDVILGTNRLVISDSKILRFDLIRWNKGVEISPKNYLLGIDQIDDLLFFSNEVWEYPRVINLKRDYMQGFKYEDVVLAKKPPAEAPQILSLENRKHENDDNDVFVSFAYRYKYLDGDYSALSFYSDTAFDPDGVNAVINAKRDNVSMVNKWDTVRIAVNSGGKNVTDIEVYAVEHGSNTAYLIYSANKKESNIGDDSLVSDVEYKFSKNYEVLDENDMMMLYSNVPKFPKTQTAAGNRMIYANYKEGYDLDGAVDFEVSKVQTDYRQTLSRKTAVSLFKYKVAIIYLNDYNEGTTGLLPTNQEKSEMEVGFADRFKNNSLRVTLKSAPPAFATKIKFVVKCEDLNYENIYSTLIKKIGSTLYVKLDGDNINRIKKGDTIIPTDEGQAYQELFVEDVKLMRKEDAKVSVTGTYAEIKIGDGINISETTVPDKYKNKSYQSVLDKDRVKEPIRFISNSSDYVENIGRYAQRVNLLKSEFGSIREGDSISIEIRYHYLQVDILKFSLIGGIFGIWTSKDEADFDFPSDVNITLTFFAEQDYENIYKLLAAQLDDTRYKLSEDGDNVYLNTTSDYAQYISANFGALYGWEPYNKGVDRKWRLAVKTNIGTRISYGHKPMRFRTKNKSVLQSFYYETPKAYRIINGKVIGDSSDTGGNPVFDIGFYNGYCWGDGFESYKIKDNFNGKPLRYNFRPNMVEKKGYKRVHRKNDITYSGLYNYEMGINNLSTFNPALANWKNLPIHYGEIQRIISTDGDISVFCGDKVISQMYGKSVLADLSGNENVAIAKDVLGDYIVLPYTFGTQHPESVVKSVDGIYFVDKKRTRYLFKADRQIIELNPEGSGHHHEGVREIKSAENFPGSYNEAHGEMNFGLGHTGIVVFNPQAKGFSFHYDYDYDYICAMNGRHFTGHRGKVFEDDRSESHNLFAGGQYRSAKLKFVVNPEPNADKIFQAMMLASNTAWHTSVRTNLTASEFPDTAYRQKESFYYTEIYRDTATVQNSKGIGVIKNIDGNTLHFSREITTEICVGDTIMDEQTNASAAITGISENTITTDQPFGAAGNYCYADKASEGGYRPDGAPIRGKWMEVTLEQLSSDPIYLNSVSTEIAKSW